MWTPNRPQAEWVAIVRVTIGAIVGVGSFSKNLGKGLYTPAGLRRLDNYYIKASPLAGGVEGKMMGLMAVTRPRWRLL